MSSSTSNPSHTRSRSDSRTRTRSMATHWILLAVASGAFAALNGLFAKLTTTESTKNFASFIARILPFLGEGFVEFWVRAACFGLNVLCNVIMWALFTRALTVSPSTTKVSITNTSTNFLVTAVLGMIVFGEQVRGLWWLGAAMMGVGCILVGMREQEEEKTKKRRGASRDHGRSARGEEEPLDEDETITLIGRENESDSQSEEEQDGAGRRSGRDQS